MGLRFFTLSDAQLIKLVKKTLCFFLLLLLCPAYAQNGSTRELKKEADKLFEDGAYTQAYKLYAQLVANFPKDPVYNFRLGVCMIYSEPDKKKSLSYLRQAAASNGEAPPETNFYLGKAHHINYLFDEAIKYYNEFKNTAPASLQKKLQPDREILACLNGKQLLSNMSDLVVTAKKELNEADYFRSYDLKDIGGKLLVKPDDFKTSTDKKKRDKSIVFLPKGSHTVYFSSYGDDGTNGKDIYTTSRLPNGTYGPPKKVEGINTAQDEDYPFLHPNGNTLYFSSKGHNSMGGYDIFKSTFNEASGTWGSPVNLEFPINSPDDDFLFVTDSLEETAYFSTGRQSPPGKIDVLKIKTQRPPIDLLVIKGRVRPGSEDQQLNSVITVKNRKTEMPLGTFEAEDNGEYTMELPNGASLFYTVETPGFKTQTRKVDLPVAATSTRLRQTISYENGNLSIKTDLEGTGRDSSYIDYLKIIEKKARLDVNESEKKVMPRVISDDVPTPVAVKNGSVTPKETTKETPAGTEPANKPAINNKELAAMARQDAEESRRVAVQMQKDASEAMETGKRQKVAADKKLAEAADAILQAEKIEDKDERKKALDEAELLKSTARNDQVVASRIISMAESIASDARAKEREASLNEQYAREVETVISGKADNNALARLEKLQNEIALAAEKSKGTEEKMGAIRTDIEEKERQIAVAVQENTELRTSIGEIQTLLAEKEKELGDTRKKSRKQAISEEIGQLREERSEKEKQLIANDESIADLNRQLSGLQSEIDIASGIKTGSLALGTTLPAGQGDKNEAEKPIRKEVEAEKQAPEKTEIAAAEPANAGELPEEINKETPKTRAGNAYQPISAASPAEAILKLDSLNSRLEANNNSSFMLGNYKDPEAIRLKEEAEARISAATDRQNQLKAAIATSKQELQNTGLASGKPDAGKLTVEAESHFAQAQKLRTEARSQKGATRKKTEAAAADLENQGNNKLLEAAEITGQENQANYQANIQNLEALLSRNKAPAQSTGSAKALGDEAALAFRQAEEIRQEARSMENTGARLGNLGNAEEKEAEAVIKLQQAVDILKLHDPDFKPVSTDKGAATEPEDMQEKLSSVNSAVDELNTVRLDSYSKLYEATDIEARRLESELAGSESSINSQDSLKARYEEGLRELREARALKAESSGAIRKEEAIALLESAMMKQINAVGLLNRVSSGLTGLAAGKPVTAKEEQVVANENANVSAPAEKEPAGKTESPVTATANPLPEDSVAAEDVQRPDGPVAAETGTVQILARLESQTLNLKNPQASQQIRNALTQLQKAEQEKNALAAEEAAGTEPAQAESPEVYRQQSESLMAEAEKLNLRVTETREEAENLEGKEKEALLEFANDLEAQSRDRSLQAAELSQKALMPEINRNSKAISELMDKLAGDQPETSAGLQTKRAEIDQLQTQAGNLRSEAMQMTNKAAQIGAMSNAEEKETELLLKQKELLDVLTMQSPEYVLPPLEATTRASSAESIAERKNAVTAVQHRELTNLTNGFSLEFESRKNQVPANLSASDRQILDSALASNAEAKRLLIRSAGEADPEEKLTLLNSAALSGNAALTQLDRIATAQAPASEKDVAALEEIGKQINAANTATPAPEPERPAPRRAAGNTVRIEGLEVIRGNAYSAAKPIPVDARIESGLIFRVQIGAFRSRIPDNAFRGLSPLNAETTQSGYLRYTAGNFNRIENANAVKNDLRGLGYSDAFVVAYFNGKRISLAEALAMMKNEGRTPDPNAPQTAGITANANVPMAINNAAVQEPVVVEKELEKTNGLLYTVQIGVYNRQVSRQRLFNLMPVYTEQLANGLYRYTAGIYNNTDRLIADKRKVNETGIKDAFVAAYINGKRVPFAEAKERQANDPSIVPEAEKPIIFPGGSQAAGTPVVTTEAASTRNTAYPAATPENGVKATEEGVCFKVQIGAYSREVPAEVAEKFSGFRTWPVETKQVNNLVIYNVGNFSAARFAKSLKEEAVRLGITDAFITVYRDGRKVYGAEASELLSR